VEAAEDFRNAIVVQFVTHEVLQNLHEITIGDQRIRGEFF
jgi:hypothetical protein